MAYPSWLPILLGFLTAVGPLSTDMYIPAFPAIEASLGLAEGRAQITLATWFAGLAIGQLAQGTLADRFGRRMPLIAGVALYVAASVGCALSRDLTTLSVMRFLSALGGSAGMVIPRAIVRDLVEGHAAARMMSRLILVMGAAPILAPTLGGLVLTVSSWHAIFWFTSAYGAICLVLVCLYLPDTQPAGHRIRLPLVGLIGRFGLVLRDRVFLCYALTGGFAMFGMFAYIGGSPPVMIDHFGFTPPQFGMLFGMSAAMFILGSQISPRLVHRLGSPRVLRGATLGYLLGVAVLLVASFTDRGGPAAVIGPIMLILFCCGFIMPNAAVGALSRHAAQAGSASAMMGTMQFLLAALSGSLVGLMSDGTARPLALLLLLGGLGAFTAHTLRPKVDARR